MGRELVGAFDGSLFSVLVETCPNMSQLVQTAMVMHEDLGSVDYSKYFLDHGAFS